MFDTAAWRRLVEEFRQELEAVPDALSDVKLSADSWSLREVVGHLIDSAANNHQRFVRLQGAAELQFPGYTAEPWVKLQRYNDVDWKTLRELWTHYNRLLLHLVQTIDPRSLGNRWLAGGQSVTLEWLVGDYYRHLVEHVEHFRQRLGEVRRR